MHKLLSDLGEGALLDEDLYARIYQTLLERWVEEEEEGWKLRWRWKRVDGS